MTIFDTITVSEQVYMLLPALSQTDLGIESGSIYRLAFDTAITSGVLKVYQGTQLIYTSAIVFVGSFGGIYDEVFVTESIVLDRRSRISLSDSITLTESVTMVRV